MVQFIFVRHGESETNRHLHNLAPGETLAGDALHAVRTHANPALTERGHAQAQCTANHVARRATQERVVAVLASPFSRAHDTALYIQPGLPPVKTCAGLREYTPALKWAWLSESERAGGEADATWQHLTARVADIVAMLERDYGQCDNDAIVLVYGHSIHISTLLTHVATQCAYMPPSIDALAIELPNCSVSVAHYYKERRAGERWRVYKTACACHLGDAATGRHAVV